MSGYIYILQEREMIRLKEPTVKIGKTIQSMAQRLHGYPKDSIILATAYVNKCGDAEKYLIAEFNKTFRRVQKYGREYFNHKSLVTMVNFFHHCSIVWTIKEGLDIGYVPDSELEVDNNLLEICNSNFEPNVSEQNNVNEQNNLIAENMIDISSYDVPNINTVSNANIAVKSVYKFCQEIYNSHPEWYKPGEEVPINVIEKAYRDYSGEKNSTSSSISKKLNGRIFDNRKKTRKNGISAKKLFTWVELQEANDL